MTEKRNQYSVINERAELGRESLPIRLVYIDKWNVRIGDRASRKNLTE